MTKGYNSQKEIVADIIKEKGAAVVERSERKPTPIDERFRLMDTPHLAPDH
jgi:hypothetical protein